MAGKMRIEGSFVAVVALCGPDMGYLTGATRIPHVHAIPGRGTNVPLYLQIVKGATPTEAGLQLVPMTLGIMSGSIISGTGPGSHRWQSVPP